MFMSRHGVTIHPIALQLGTASMSPVTAVGGGGGGGGAVFLAPLLASLLAPLLAAGPSTAPTATPPPPPVVAGAVTPGGAPAPTTGGGAAVVPVPPAAPSRGAVVLTQGPVRPGAVARRAGRPPLPFTGEDFRLPVFTGLQLIALGAVLRYGAWRLERRRSRSHA
jgi:hypothetical protein